MELRSWHTAYPAPADWCQLRRGSDKDCGESKRMDRHRAHRRQEQLLDGNSSLAVLNQYNIKNRNGIRPDAVSVFNIIIASENIAKSGVTRGRDHAEAGPLHCSNPPKYPPPAGFHTLECHRPRPCPWARRWRCSG